MHSYSQYKNNPSSLYLYSPQTPYCFPLKKINPFSIITPKKLKFRTLDTIQVCASVQRPLIKVKEIIQTQEAALKRASKFIERISKEKMQRRGLYIVLKQKQQQMRKIELSIERSEEELRLQEQKSQRREKAFERIQQCQRRIKDRESYKSKRRTYVQSSNSIHSPSASSQSCYKNRRTPVSQQKAASSSILSNSAYLDHHDQQTQQANRLLARLSQAITNVQKLRSQC